MRDAVAGDKNYCSAGLPGQSCSPTFASIWPGVGKAPLCLKSSLLGTCWLSAVISAASLAQQLGMDWVQLQGLWNQVDSKVLLSQEAPCRRPLCPPQLHHPLFVQLLTHCPEQAPGSGLRTHSLGSTQLWHRSHCMGAASGHQTLPAICFEAVHSQLLTPDAGTCMSSAA